MRILTTIDLLALPSLETPPTGHVGFGAKADGLYQKIGTTETKLSVDGHTHTFASLTDRPTTLSGYGITDAATINHTHGLTRYSLAAPAFIDGLTTSNFRTTLFGSSTQGYNISTARWQETNVLGLGYYGTMIAWSGADTHGFLALNYNSQGAVIGGGNGDSINWSATLLNSLNYNNYAPTKTGVGASGTWGIDITGNASTATKLQTVRNIAGTPFDGTTNIDISFTNLVNRPTTLAGYGITDAANVNHTHNYLPLSGGTLTGYIITKTLPIPVASVNLLGYSTSTEAPIKIPDRNVGTTYGYMPFISAANLSSSGYRQNISIGAYRAGSTWNASGVYIAMGGSDTSPTEAFRFTLGRVIENTGGAISLIGNASTATVATKLGTVTVGGTVKPFYLNAGEPIAFSTTVGSATLPVYMNEGSITVCTSFGGLTGIGTATPLMDGTAAVGISTLAARQDHIHPTDTSRAAVGQTMYIGTTAVAINRASATLNLTGIGSLAMGGALTGVTTLTASTSVTVPKVIFAVGGWSVEQTGTEIQFKYNGVIKQRLLSDGSIVAVGEVTAYGATS